MDWSRFSAAPASSDAIRSRHWPGRGTACAPLCAARILRVICNPWGRSGQIHAVQANLRYPQSLKAAAEGADAVVNLVAILAPSGRKQTFEALHVDGARAVATCGARGWRQAFRARLGHWRRQVVLRGLRPHEGTGRASGAGGIPRRNHHSPVDRLRTGRCVLQPFRVHGRYEPVPAAHRRRQDASSSRSMSAMSPPRSPTLLQVQASPAPSTRRAGLRCSRSAACSN